MTGKTQTGRRGEDAAAEYLTARGHVVVARNWRGGHTELDIITIDGGGLHFVEVKTRVAPVTAAPEENVDWRKRKNVVSAARRFIRSSPEYREMEMFFDVVTVVFEGEVGVIEYYPQAWVPMYV